MAALSSLKGDFGHNLVHTLNHPRAQCTVVFFPGDRIMGADTLKSIMRLQDPQALAQLLQSKFPAPTVHIVMPSRYEACFACYDHFLAKVTRSGEPLGYHGGSLRATHQLSSLLHSAGWDSGLPCHLVGFSKGGVVLNQVLAELAALARGGPSDSSAERGGGLRGAASLAAALCQVHFVDAGLNCRGAHLTDPEAVQELGRWCQQHPQLRLFLHGTPRQWDDPRRPWISIEKNRFYDMCRAAGVPVEMHKYEEGQPPSLAQHFRALELFSVA